MLDNIRVTIRKPDEDPETLPDKTRLNGNGKPVHDPKLDQAATQLGFGLESLGIESPTTEEFKPLPVWKEKLIKGLGGYAPKPKKRKSGRLPKDFEKQVNENGVSVAPITVGGKKKRPLLETLENKATLRFRWYQDNLVWAWIWDEENTCEWVAVLTVPEEIESHNDRVDFFAANPQAFNNKIDSVNSTFYAEYGRFYIADKDVPSLISSVADINQFLPSYLAYSLEELEEIELVYEILHKLPFYVAAQLLESYGFIV